MTVGRANGVVYFGSDDRNVYALSSISGLELWSFTTGNFVFSSPAVANGVVCVGSADRNVYASDLAGGVAARARPAAGKLRPNYALRAQHCPLPAGLTTQPRSA